MYGNVNFRDQAIIRIQSTSTIVSEATLPIDDITIEGCKFTNNSQRLAIHLNSARNIRILNNVFDENDKTIAPEIDGTAVLLDTCMNVEISGNTYNYAHFEGNIKNVVKGENYAGVYGSDVTDKDGSSLII
jgi:polygalacturonase